MNFVKRQPVVSAVQFSGTRASGIEIAMWTKGEVLPIIHPDDISMNMRKMAIHNRVGYGIVNEGDWVIQDGEGNITICDPVSFKKQYAVEV